MNLQTASAFRNQKAKTKIFICALTILNILPFAESKLSAKTTSSSDLANTPASDFTEAQNARFTVSYVLTRDAYLKKLQSANSSNTTTLINVEQGSTPKPKLAFPKKQTSTNPRPELINATKFTPPPAPKPKPSVTPRPILINATEAKDASRPSRPKPASPPRLHTTSTLPAATPPPSETEPGEPSADASVTTASSTPLLVNRGGKIMPTVVTKNIFWGPSWANYVGDKMTGMDTFCRAYSNSDYARTVDEYTGSNGPIGSTITHQGYVIDTTNATRGSNVNAILKEVCKMIPSPDPSGNGFYAVFTDLPRGTASYCAYHSFGTCGGIRVQFGFFWKLDGDAACNPRSQVTGRSQGLAALANVYAHEIHEARTDPQIGTWMDSAGQENADKCAWAFKSPYVTLSDGSQWKLQSEWSNMAYLAGTGYPNLSGQRGCI